VELGSKHALAAAAAGSKQQATARSPLPSPRPATATATPATGSWQLLAAAAGSSGRRGRPRPPSPVAQRLLCAVCYGEPATGERRAALCAAAAGCWQCHCWLWHLACTGMLVCRIRACACALVRSGSEPPLQLVGLELRVPFTASRGRLICSPCAGVASRSFSPPASCSFVFR
jgi:hypothetical protein